jgi:hypothetical protein
VRNLILRFLAITRYSRCASKGTSSTSRSIALDSVQLVLSQNNKQMTFIV